MIFTYETVWESCSKEEYDKEAHKLFNSYRRVPIYNNKQVGILEHIKLFGIEPDEWRYEKAAGKKQICILTTKEAEDKELMALLRRELELKEDKV